MLKSSSRSVPERGIARTPEDRAGMGPRRPVSSEERLRSALAAYDQQRRAEDSVRVQDEAGSTFSRTIARRRLDRSQQAYQDALGRPAVDAPAKRPALPAMPKPPGSVTNGPVSVDQIAANTPPTASLETAVPAPDAVIDPASQINPDEQQARLRARLYLMNGAQRPSGRIFASGTNVGLRSLGAF